MNMMFSELKKNLEAAEQQGLKTEARLRGEVVGLLLQLSDAKRTNERLEKELATVKRNNEARKFDNFTKKLAEIQRRVDIKKSQKTLNQKISSQGEMPTVETLNLPEPKIKEEQHCYDTSRFDFTQNFKL